MTSYSQNDYYYNNENDALSYNSRPISSTNYSKTSSFGNTTDPMLLKRDNSYRPSSAQLNSMYDNYGSFVGSSTSSVSDYSGRLRGSGPYYRNTSMNDNDIYQQQQQNQPYSQNTYEDRGGGTYYNGSCDNMTEYRYADNGLSGRHSSMSTTAKQLPQIPMKHSSSMVDGISYTRGASLPTTPPVAHKKSRMLPQPTTANGGIGGTTGKCLPAIPRALPKVNSSNKYEPSARSGTGRKLLPTPNHKQNVSMSYDTAIPNNTTYSNVPLHTSISSVSYSEYSDYGYNSPTSLHSNDVSLKNTPDISGMEYSSASGISSKVTTRDLLNSAALITTSDDSFYDVRASTSEASSASIKTHSSLSGNGSGGVGRKLPKRLPTPNLKSSNGSASKQLPKLPQHKNNKSLFTVSTTTAADSVTITSMDYSKSYSPYSYTSTSPSMTSTEKISVNGSFDINRSNHSSYLYPPSNSLEAPVSISGYHSSYMQTSTSVESASPSALLKPSATSSTAVTSLYDDRNATIKSSLDSQYHSYKSYPPEITTTATATVTAAVTSTSVTTTTTSSNNATSFSVTDYLKKFDIATPLSSSKLSKTTTTTTNTTTTTITTNNCKLCKSNSDSCNCSFSTTLTTSNFVSSSLVASEGSSLNTEPSSTTNYASYISDYLKIYASSSYSYDSVSTIVDTNMSSRLSITADTTATTTTLSSYISSYIGSDYSSPKIDEFMIKTSTPTCDQNGCGDYSGSSSSKYYDSIDYFSVPATTTDYSEYLSLAKPTTISTSMTNGEELSSSKYIDTFVPTTTELDVSTYISDMYNYSPTPTVTTVASNDDPYSYLDAYKVDLPVYTTDLELGSCLESSFVLDTYTEPNYSTTISKTSLETSNNEYYDEYRSSTTTPITTEYKSYLYETNSNSGSGSGSGSSSNVSSDHLLAKYDLTTSSSASSASGSTVVTTRNTTIGGGYYQPVSSKSAISLNTSSSSSTSTPQKAAAAAANKASSMFGSLSHGLKGGLDGVLSGVAAVTDNTKQQPQQQQSQQQSATSGMKSSAKSFGFGFASKLIPNLGGASQPSKTTSTTISTAQNKTTTPSTTITTSGIMDSNKSQQQYIAAVTTINNYEYNDRDHLRTSSAVSTWGDWTGAVESSRSIYVTDSLTYDTDYSQGPYENTTTTSSERMILDDSYDSILTQPSSMDGSQSVVVMKAVTTTSASGGKIVDYSDDYKYGYDEHSYSENDYIATGDITDNQNYNNNYDYMDDDATIVSQLLDNAAEKMAEEAIVTTMQQQTTTASSSVTSSFDATTTMDMMDVTIKPPVQVTSAMTTAQQQQQQQVPAKTATVAAPQSKSSSTSLLSSLTSVAIGGQQPQGQQQQPAAKASSSSGGGLFGSFLGKAAAAVQSATQVVSTATAMTTAAVNVVPSTFGGDQKNVAASTAQNRHDTEMSNAVVSGASGAAVVTSMDDYENSNLYEDDYYGTSTTTTNTATNANSNLAQKMLPTVPLSSGKKLPAINGKSGLLMKQQPTEIYDEEEEEYIDELDPNYRMDSEQDDYYMDQTAPSTLASMMAANGYYVPPDGGYDYREDYFNEEDEYKYLEKEQQIKEMRHQQLMKHKKQPPLEYIEESRDDYIDDNYPSEDSANYIDDVMTKEPPLQFPVVTTTSAAQTQQQSQPASITSITSPTNGAAAVHYPIKKQDSIIEEDEDDILLTPDDSLKTDDRLLQLQEEPLPVRKKTLTRGETEEVTSGQLKRKPEITARQRWNWAYNKIIMQLNPLRSGRAD